MSKGLNTNRIIVNSGAPVVQIVITVDNRYNPPELAMQISHPMPALATAGYIYDCLGNVLRMMIQAEAAGAAKEKQPDSPPNLPPAPSLQN